MGEELKRRTVAVMDKRIKLAEEKLKILEYVESVKESINAS